MDNLKVILIKLYLFLSHFPYIWPIIIENVYLFVNKYDLLTEIAEQNTINLRHLEKRCLSKTGVSAIHCM